MCEPTFYLKITQIVWAYSTEPMPSLDYASVLLLFRPKQYYKVIKQC